ncbi:Permease of the drug/metabolite transporter (DMT) superfamily [Pseudobutyrivibrio sp. 49]|uniref:DMT family transporter n=1 Tax=Pseudobutyrivibrio sp. 49 TaxID=1855344 RepID=UPI000884A622|nr:DMT family transporter [Pseudobutyrivibrio sp. 49]SDH73710.1 Permease of the drug/metabolite transporter (DMT) superfamily [Pseudobutyrivibrio sp. 49]
MMKDINKISNKSKGIICILFAAFGFSLMTFFVRISGDIPTMEKAFFRNAVAIIASLILLAKSGEKIRIQKGCGTDIFFRCLFGTSGLIANFYAIDKLNIADANMLNKLSPFFAILISIPILKEKPKKIDILAVIIAFFGAMLIVKPTGSNMQLVPALIGLYGGFGAGTAYVFVRRLGKKGERTPIIVLCFSVFSTVVTIPFIVMNYVPLKPIQLLCLVMAGLSATIGQFGITSAYKFAPAKEISVFDYTQVIFAAILGILFLGELPTLLSFIGYVVIIGVAVFRWRYNLKEQ